jgi:sulfur-carrier protein
MSSSMNPPSFKLRYFASLREALSTAEERVEPPVSVASVADLRAHLAGRGGEWQRLVTMKNLRCAVNQDVAADTTLLRDGDEIAFFPPVTGG